MTVLQGSLTSEWEEKEKPYEVVRMYIKAKEFYEKVMKDKKVKDKRNKRAEQTMLPGSKLTQNMAVTVLLGAITVGHVPQRKTSIANERKVFLINVSPIDGMRFECEAPSDLSFTPFKMNSEKIEERIQKDKEKESEQEIEKERVKEREERSQRKVERDENTKEMKVRSLSLQLKQQQSPVPSKSIRTVVNDCAWEEIKNKKDIVNSEEKGDAETRNNIIEMEEVVEGRGVEARGHRGEKEKQWEEEDSKNERHRSIRDDLTLIELTPPAPAPGLGPGGAQIEIERCMLEGAHDYAHATDIRESENEENATSNDHDGEDEENDYSDNDNDHDSDDDNGDGDRDSMDLAEVIDSAIKKKDEKEKEREKKRNLSRVMDVNLGLSITSSPLKKIM